VKDDQIVVMRLPAAEELEGWGKKLWEMLGWVRGARVEDKTRLNYGWTRD
jgi:hypothetical protein